MNVGAKETANPAQPSMAHTSTQDLGNSAPENPSEPTDVGQTEPLPLSLWDMIKEDWVAHGKDWTLPGFRAVAVHRFGVWRMQVKSKALRAPLSILYRSLYRKVRNGYGIELPYTVRLGRRVVIEHQSDIVIHGYCVIGDDTIIRQGVTMGLRHLDRPLDAPQLGCRVNIGAGAKLFGNISVGDDANIGANAVVLSDVPEQATAVGIPARILQKSSSSSRSKSEDNE